MINYGAAPADDEIEVTLFGPGFGEAIAIHVGEQNWILVDSCIDPDAGAPASLTYLTHIGVAPNQVRTIVASHWHDDHVRGISKMAASYPDAEFHLSSIFNNKEATSFLAAYSGSSAPGQARGAKELFDVITQRENVFHLLQRSNVLELELATGRQVRVTALSPVQAAISQSIAHMAQYLPSSSGGSPINHAPELAPNLEAVSIHIDLGDDAVLLGSDLEDHATLGWSAVVADSWSSTRRPASAYKVAHHGSYTGDTPVIWTTLLRAKPIACMTPFNLGKHSLPTESDKARIKGHTPHAYISSGATKKPDLDSTQLKRLADICKNLSRVNAGFGAVRLRKRFGAADWMVECFGRAQKL